MEDENKYAEDIELEDGDTRQMYEHFKFVADKGQELLRIDKFLVARTGNISRNRIQQAADAGCILVNGRPVKSNYRVKPLDVVSIVMDRPPYENEILPENIPLDVVYEDHDVLVVNKPAGLVVHPGHGTTPVRCSMPWPIASRTTPTSTLPTRGWGWCIASTRTRRGCWS